MYVIGDFYREFYHNAGYIVSIKVWWEFQASTIQVKICIVKIKTLQF